MEKYGFIGMGNMAKALAEGFIKAGAVKKENVYAFAPNQDKLRKNAEKIGFIPVEDVNKLVKMCDTIIIACKPYQIESVLDKTISNMDDKVIISIAAGWDYNRYVAYGNGILCKNNRLQFVMPNTPAMVSEGVLLFEQKNTLNEEERKQAMELFSALGTVVELPSSLMGIGSAVAGCAPAFVDMFIEGYADAAVKYGIARDDAYRIISQMVMGSAKLQLETGLHPGVLKDQVCSPNGTTIRGVAKLEEKGFRDACISSIDAIMDMKR